MTAHLPNSGRRPTRSEAIAAAGEVLARGEAAAARMTPREQAEAAWESDEIATVDELETQIRALRVKAAQVPA
jgi:hypothetical protein